MLDDPASIQYLRLAFFFMSQTSADEVEGVQVLQFRLRTEFFLAEWTDGNVGIATHGAFFHLHIGYVCVHDDLAYGIQVSVSFFRGAHIRFRYDFDQWRSLTVQIDIGIAVRSVHIFAGIFFKMDALDADLFLDAFHFDFNPAVMADRVIQLRNLVRFRIVRIEVVFAVEVRFSRDFTVQSQSGLHAEFDCALVDDRQDARVTPVDDVCVCVRFCPKVCWRWGEHF